MIADFVTATGDLAKDVAMLLLFGILSDEEKRDFDAEFVERIEYARDQQIQIRRERLPRRIPVRLHVRPLIVEVQRQRRLHAGTASRNE